MEVYRENVGVRGDPSTTGQGSPFAVICMFRLVSCAPPLEIPFEALCSMVSKPSDDVFRGNKEPKAQLT
jgi:hypothetical protein